MDVNGHLDVEGGVSGLSISVPGGTLSNIGLDLTSGILKIVSADGTDLGSTNKGYVTMPSALVSGTFVTLEVTAATHLFEDASGTSDINGEEFGVTSGVAWNETRPFYLYAVNLDDTSAGLRFAISASPVRTKTPGSSFLGYHGNPMASPTDSGFFFFTSTSVAAYGSVPTLLIGSIGMKKTTTADDWTVDALTYDTGIGRFQENNMFVFPTGQMGAESGKHISSGGGTTPDFTGADFVGYSMNREGMMYLRYILVNTSGGNSPSGAFQVSFKLPYGISQSQNGAGMVYHINGGARAVANITVTGSNFTDFFAFEMATLINLNNDDFNNVSRRFYISTNIRVFSDN